jgi:hypothetical protein
MWMIERSGLSSWSLRRADRTACHWVMSGRTQPGRVNAALSGLPPIAAMMVHGSRTTRGCHVWTAPSWQGLSSICRSSRISERWASRQTCARNLPTDHRRPRVRTWPMRRRACGHRRPPRRQIEGLCEPKITQYQRSYLIK